MILISPWSRLWPILWSRVLSREWRCSWSGADRRCSGCIWVIDYLIAYQGASYITDLTVGPDPCWCPDHCGDARNIVLMERALWRRPTNWVQLWLLLPQCLTMRGIENIGYEPHGASVYRHQVLSKFVDVKWYMLCIVICSTAIYYKWVEITLW